MTDYPYFLNRANICALCEHAEGNNCSNDNIFSCYDKIFCSQTARYIFTFVGLDFSECPKNKWGVFRQKTLDVLKVELCQTCPESTQEEIKPDESTAPAIIVKIGNWARKNISNKLSCKLCGCFCELKAKYGEWVEWISGGLISGKCPLMGSDGKSVWERGTHESNEPAFVYEVPSELIDVCSSCEHFESSTNQKICKKSEGCCSHRNITYRALHRLGCPCDKWPIQSMDLSK